MKIGLKLSVASNRQKLNMQFSLVQPLEEIPNQQPGTETSKHVNRRNWDQQWAKSKLHRT